MKPVYTHEVLDQLVELLSLPRPIVNVSSQIIITLTVGDYVRVTYETIPEKTDEEEPF